MKTTKVQKGNNSNDHPQSRNPVVCTVPFQRIKDSNSILVSGFEFQLSHTKQNYRY
jgi:hypothetical protein